MTGESLINLISLMSYGRIRIENEERHLNLQYLNLANIDLWTTMVNAREQIEVLNLEFGKSKFSDYNYSFEEKNNKLELHIDDYNDLVYVLKGVFNSKGTLNKCKISNILHPETQEYSTYGNKFIFLNEDINKNINLAIIKNPPEISDNALEIKHYPKVFQSALIEGALYYCYLSTFGFMDKIQIQLQVWENLKNSLIYHNVSS